MSMPRTGRARVPIRLPSVKMPSLGRSRRNPPGWNTTEISIRNRREPYMADLRQREPAGDPPPSFPGTRPEWAIFWAFRQMGWEPDFDFVYQARMPGVGSDYYSTLDFLVSRLDIGIEIQGAFWHMEQGSDRIYKDALRRALYAGQGLRVIGIDEDDALTAPRYFLEEALAGNDHSQASKGM